MPLNQGLVSFALVRTYVGSFVSWLFRFVFVLIVVISIG